MARVTKKHNGKKRGPKKGSKHSRQHNNAIAEGMKKYWATKGKRRTTKKHPGRKKTSEKIEIKPKRKIRYLNKNR